MVCYVLIAGFVFWHYIYITTHHFPDEDYLFLYLFIFSLISQIGDLIISYFKRKAKIKDTGKILPGHGGLLDRIDGMIFAFPFIYLITSV